MKIFHQQTLVVITVALAVIGAPGSAAAAKITPINAAKCDAAAAKVNGRAKQLASYQKAQDAHYKKLRKGWSDRIAYAGRWVPDAATKARNDLSKYDKLVEAFDQDLSKQIAAAKAFESNPVDCSGAKRADLKRAIAMARTGHTQLEKDRKAILTFLRGDFKRDMNAMITKLHQAKAKHPKPIYEPVRELPVG